MTDVATVLRILPVVVACGWLAAPASAQSRCAGTPISSARLSAVEVGACIRQRHWIEHATIQGPDIIAAVAASPDSGPIRIRASVIEGGLYFSNLPAVGAAALPGPIDAEMRRLDWYGSDDNVRVVNVRIQLHDTRILAGQDYDEDEYGPVALSAGRVIFTKDVDLLGSTIAGSARFSRAAFLGRALFRGVRFGRRTTFDGAGLLGDGSFTDARFEGPALFTYTRFSGRTDFRRARFDRAPIFDKLRACGELHFGETSFTTGARFVGARLASFVTFADADMPKGADLADAHFAATLDLAGIRGAGLLTFARARIRELKLGSPEYRSRIEAELDFSEAAIAQAEIAGVRIDAPVTLARARLGPDGFSTDVHAVNHEPRMRRSAARHGCPVPAAAPASIKDPAIRFRSVDFNGGANMTGVTFAGADSRYLPFAGLRFNNVDLDWDSLAPFQSRDGTPGERPASEVFEQIEARFRERGRLTDALSAKRASRWATVREAGTCLGMMVPWRGDAEIPIAASSCREPGTAARSLRDAVLLPVWGLSSGFGTLFPRLLLLIIAVHLAFTVAYRRGGTVIRRVAAPGEEPPGPRLHPLLLPKPLAPAEDPPGTWAAQHGWRAPAALSTLALLRFGASGIAVRGRSGAVSMPLLVSLEWALGIPLVVDLINTLGETQPFLQRLLTGTIG